MWKILSWLNCADSPPGPTVATFAPLCRTTREVDFIANKPIHSPFKRMDHLSVLFHFSLGLIPTMLYWTTKWFGLGIREKRGIFDSGLHQREEKFKVSKEVG